MTPTTISYIPLKDPNSPKHHDSAYIHFANEMREQFKIHHPGTTYDKLPKFTYSVYDELPLMEKKVWEARAAADKIRYFQELAAYIPPPGYDSTGRAIPTWPNFSFNFFTSEMRPKLQDDHPDLPFADISRIILDQWWNLPSNVKQKYTDLELQDRLRFNEQMQQYQPQHQSYTLETQPATSFQINLHHIKEITLCSTPTFTTSITTNENVKNNNITNSTKSIITKDGAGDGTVHSGQVLEVSGNNAIVPIFDGTNHIDNHKTKFKFTGDALKMSASEEMLEHSFNGSEKIIDPAPKILAEAYFNINGQPINPSSRDYSKAMIQTSISAIDILTSVARGQKIRILSTASLPHHEVASLLAPQVSLVQQKDTADGHEKNFCIMFGAMGVDMETPRFSRSDFIESGSALSTRPQLHIFVGAISAASFLPTFCAPFSYNNDNNTILKYFSSAASNKIQCNEIKLSVTSMLAEVQNITDKFWMENSYTSQSPFTNLEKAHTSEFILGYKRAVDKLYELLHTLMVRPCNDPRTEEELSRVTLPVVMAKQYGILAPLFSDACRSVMNSSEKSSGKLTISPAAVRVVNILGGSVSTSAFLCGMVGTVLLKTAADLRGYNKSDDVKMEDIIKGIKEAGVDVCVAAGSVSEMALHFLTKFRLLTIKVGSNWDLWRSYRAVKATVLVRMGPPMADAMDLCNTVYVKEIDDKHAKVFEHKPEKSHRECAIATILLRAIAHSLSWLI
jgi:hypothetical protein